MEINSYFLDTYAMHEIIKGNPNYLKFNKNTDIVTTKLNLLELYYSLLVKYNEDIAELAFIRFIEYCIDFTDNSIIKETAIFRKINIKRKMSYIDCLGYTVARRNGIKFLTGDKEFKDLENVEFVK